VLNARPRFANARFRRAFSYKCELLRLDGRAPCDCACRSLGQFDEAAKDFEDSRQLQPHNPRLVVNYLQMRDCPFIELVCPGQEADVDL
jgi:Flp pilus assembly protein TadD